MTQWFPNTRSGWPAKYISDSALAMADLGHQVSVDVLRGWVPPFAQSIAPNVYRGSINPRDFPELERLKRHVTPIIPGNLFRPTSTHILDLIARRMAIEAIKSFRPDVIHIQAEGLAPAVIAEASRRAIPCAVTIHGENTNRSYLKQRFRGRFRIALATADKILIVGETLRPYAAELSGRTDNISVVWNGIDPSSPSKETLEPTETFRIISVANLVEEKGIGLLISAIANAQRNFTRDWRLTIVGEGPLKAKLRMLTETLGIGQKIRFLGALSNEMVLKELPNHDAFILPSYKEAFGIVYLEAMTAGLLTIGVKDQGPSAFITDGISGFLVEGNNCSDLERALIMVLSLPPKQHAVIAENGRTTARTKFSWRSHAQTLTAELAEITRPTA